VMHGYAAAEGAQPVGDDGWLRTADRCQVAGDRVRWLGRQDATINVGGSKVYPLMVESFLLSQPGVSEARVFGVRNPISGQLVAAEVVLSAGFDPAEARPRILAACRAAMPGYQVPRQLAFVEAIAAHTSGKKG
jgi:acyl-coenzyme A synthetase/AMP-(fatty) acid ligase